MRVPVYVAGPFGDRRWFRVLRRALVEEGRARGVQIELTSRWIDSPDGLTDANVGERQSAIAGACNLLDVLRADAFVCVNPPRTKVPGNGGRHVEFGYALAHSKQMILVGWDGSPFHKLPPVVRLPWSPSVAEVARRIVDVLARDRAERAA